eukprot:CAMPEP_0171018466 /NCGR_PEP_ID=MMETSP0736-20130129/28340_1 /TAXON_ID=186038 /ORGANISM="Fragilariopsis kerguelensis, Strain L26-C5" /LENGTH=206 /DNA_ID=CAMNT_0011455089 /DNA_START=253 /DNA_END=871 /DNA_ORIENTATION=+
MKRYEFKHSRRGLLPGSIESRDGALCYDDDDDNNNNSNNTSTNTNSHNNNNNRYEEYGYHLRNLIQDVRHDLPNATQLPVVIGELGVGIRRPVDYQYEGCTNGENDAEKDIDCNHNPDPLLRHYQDRLQQFQTMQQQSVTMMNRMMMSDDGTTNDDDADTNVRYNTMYVPTEQYLLPEQDDDDSSEKRYDNGYHYYGRADTVYRIG